MNKKKRKLSKKSKLYLRKIIIGLGGGSVIWGMLFICIKIISSGIAYGPRGLQNEIAAAISAYAFEVMSGIWGCVVMGTLIYQGKKLIDALQNQEEEAQRKKNEMLAYLAHDLRTPLTSVLGYAHLLDGMENLTSKEAREYIKVIVNKSELLEDMLDEFFEMTKLETGNVQMNVQKINLAEMVQQLVCEYIPILKEKSLELACDVISTANVSCDLAKMERVFDNLMRNVMKYAKPASIVKVTGNIQDNMFTICFDNQAEQIEQEQLVTMFEPFVRLDEARKDVEGAGIGLAIVKEIIELHQGNIEAKYEDGRLKIWIRLPIAEEINLHTGE